MAAIWHIADNIAREHKTSLHNQATPQQVRRFELALFGAYWFAMGAIAGWIAAGWAQ